MLEFDREGLDADALLEAAIEADADDVIEEDETIRVHTTPESFEPVKQALEAAGFTAAECAEIQMEPAELRCRLSGGCRRPCSGSTSSSTSTRTSRPSTRTSTSPTRSWRGSRPATPHRVGPGSERPLAAVPPSAIGRQAPERGDDVRILGIDPGSHQTGWGVIDCEGSTVRRVAGDVIRARGDTLAERLVSIHSALIEVIREYRPDAAALESVFTHRNPRSALILGHARGAALTTCGLAGLRTSEYAPAHVKVAVSGYGRAAKPQVQRMVRHLLGLDVEPRADEADALAVAICHSRERRLEARPPRRAAADVRGDA